MLGTIADSSSSSSGGFAMVAGGRSDMYSSAMETGSSRLRIRREIIVRLIEEARREPQIECCGLLAGSGGVIAEIFPAKNALASVSAYEIAPEELFRLFRQMRERSLDHLGIYHSHPATDNSPSPTDIERAYYPDAAYFIVSSRPDAPHPVRAFRIRQGIMSECEIEQVEGEPGTDLRRIRLQP